MIIHIYDYNGKLVKIPDDCEYIDILNGGIDLSYTS